MPRGVRSDVNSQAEQGARSTQGTGTGALAGGARHAGTAVSTGASTETAKGMAPEAVAGWLASVATGVRRFWRIVRQRIGDG